MFKKSTFIKVISASLLSLMLLSGCSYKESKEAEEKDNTPLTKTEFYMGTVITISLYDHKDEKILDEAFERVKSIEAELSINAEGTEIDKINEAAGKEAIKVSEDAFTNIKKGLEYSKETEGTFDITIGPLVKLWSIGLPEAKVPTEEEIKAAISHIGYDKVVLDEDKRTVFLQEEGMMLDLGSIAKGYTADVIGELLKSHGVENALIDLGGNILALGENPEGRPWKIGVQNPEDTRGEIIGYVSIENKSVVTSGIYERFLEQDGKKYHHLLNPFTGYPYDNELMGVTIISDESIDGDALSTSVFSKGLQGGIEFIETIEDVDAIFVTKEKNIYMTSGLKDNFVITNNSFTIAE
ncbi:FAD:protein FMN transferase [Alloiococcus sp. CFN-8]|uniref:FAD:protein FMN transferase n=1 Tax=Alloiococcus sp. CFN-8 TaxID=3416081 RepID=UPI003CEF9FA8